MPSHLAVSREERSFRSGSIECIPAGEPTPSKRAPLTGPNGVKASAQLPLSAAAQDLVRSSAVLLAVVKAPQSARLPAAELVQQAEPLRGTSRSSYLERRSSPSV